jgi:uncharacterized protein (TIGR02145 family)
MNTKRKLIALTLTNILNTDSEVNLLSSLDSGNDIYYKVKFLDIFPNVVFGLFYTLNGTPITYSVSGGSSLLDVESLILDLNTGLGAYALFSYELSSTPNYYTLIIKIIDSTFAPVKLVENIGGGCIDCVAHDVTIGTQVWAGCNLNVETYRNEDPIPEVTDPIVWEALTTGAWCYYNNDPSNEATYGKLYNWYAVNDPRGLAPVGYHIPSKDEWITTIDYLGGFDFAGGEMKETGFCHWETPNTGATNSSSFTALPGGRRNRTGNYNDIGFWGYWWGSSVDYLGRVFLCNIAHDDVPIYSATSNIEPVGLSVRLIKD